jgi:3-oxoacyl-[acyl-carrier protein] reductase
MTVASFPDLAGKVAVVTGGSKGIGAETTRTLAANGAAVAVVARDRSGIDALLEELHDQGATAAGVVADVTDAASLAAAAREVGERLGPVDVLVPFAGGFNSHAPIWEIPEAEWRQVVDVNLTATFLTMQAFLPVMMERRSGSIVVMSSVASRAVDRPLTASYVAAKAGALMLMRHAAVELGPYGIRVNAIAPGTVRTERTDRMMDDDDRALAAGLSPLGRMGTTTDCATATAFLASDAAGWITGATLDVSGGRVML